MKLFLGVFVISAILAGAVESYSHGHPVIGGAYFAGSFAASLLLLRLAVRQRRRRGSTH